MDVLVSLVSSKQKPPAKSWHELAVLTSLRITLASLLTGNNESTLLPEQAVHEDGAPELAPRSAASPVFQVGDRLQSELSPRGLPG